MPKHVKMMILDTCPHCKRAFQMMNELMTANPAYREVKFEVIEEQTEPQKTEGYDYRYVPTFFIGDVKVHEGTPTAEALEMVFKKALE